MWGAPVLTVIRNLLTYEEEATWVANEQLKPQAALFRGDCESAKKYVASGLKLLPDEPLMISLNGVLHALHQDSGAALDCVHQTCESPRSFGHTHHTHYQIACTYALLGQPGKAFEWLERTTEVLLVGRCFSAIPA